MLQGVATQGLYSVPLLMQEFTGNHIWVGVPYETIFEL
jgi:hypothetical protein